MREGTDMMKSMIVAALALAGTASASFAQDAAKALIAKGEYLARAGDCVACHTAPGGKPFAGGLAIKSDLGSIFSTNITPDKQTGIGDYTEAQFTDAVRNGVRADGAHLYPAMPYPSYHKVADEDMHALYTYFMHGVEPVSNKPTATALSFPFSQRWGMWFWNLAFDAPSDAPKSAAGLTEVQRGEYLVEGLGHCGSCHTPRGFAMQETAYDTGSDSYLSGGDLNGWPVPSLRARGSSAEGIVGWSQQDIVDYLGMGRNRVAAVGGEMTSVIEHSMGYMNDGDLNAIAAYLKSLPAEQLVETKPDAAAGQTIQRLTAAKDLTLGERLYLDNCSACHLVTGKGGPKVFPQIDGASVATATSPVGLIHTILNGAATPSTDRAPSVLTMPGFGSRLKDDEVAALASFLRGAWTNSAGAVSTADVAKVRSTLKDETASSAPASN
jgi:mono/diheme cytochrome c family protein